MKTADEMFEELDYKKSDNHPEQDYPPEPNTWTTQDERVIEYIQEGKVNGQLAREIISFYPNREMNVLVRATIGNRTAPFVPLSPLEITAIYTKLKELQHTRAEEAQEGI